MMHVNLDGNFVDKIVNEVKSQGVFDQFRKDSMADVDTKPAYQNLRQRVENSVSKYLSEQKWSPETNKNQLRERLRTNLMNAGFLDVGVQRIVDQVVNPKISTVFQPKIEDIVYKYLGIEKPEPKIEEKILPIGLNGNLTIKTDGMDLLPHDLEAVSPDSDKSTVKSEPRSDSKMDITNDLDDDDESPPFEPLEGVNLIKIKDDENSNNSIMSGLSGLASQESNKIKDEHNNTTTVINNSMEISQESQLSQVSSNSHLSIVTNDEGTDKDVKPIVKEETNVHISEEAQMPKFNENSNSCPNISAEKLHFDIKKDEIKFEGTDRNIEQNISTEQNNLIDSPENIKTESNVQLAQCNEEISNTTLNTENSSYFDDDSEKCLQIVEEPTESSQISQPSSLKNLPETNIPLYDNLTESSDTLKTNSPLIEKHNISPNSKASENSENQKLDDNIKNNLEKSENLKSDDSSDMTLPPPSNSGGDNKLSSVKSHSKERESSNSNSSRHISHKKHSKDKKSDKDKDKNRKTSSTSDSKKNDNGNKHSSSRHSSQSSSRSIPSSKDNKDNKSSSSSSSSHKSKHYSKDEKSSKYDKDRKKDKNSRDEKSPKTSNKDKSKEIDDHSLAKNKNYRRKSTDSNDGDTNKEGGNKIIKNGSDKNENSSFTSGNNISNSTNNTNDSGASMDSENKVSDNNLPIQKSENLSKPIIVDNLNNIEFHISSSIINHIPTSNKLENDIIKSNNLLQVREIITPTEVNKNDIDAKNSSIKVDKIDIESEENDLEYFEITPEEEQNYRDLMNRYEHLLSKMFNANEILNEFCKNNNINMNSPKPNRKEKLNGKRKRKNDLKDSTITHTITTAEPIDNTLTIGCFEYDYNSAKRIKSNDMNVLLTTKISPTPSDMSIGSKENDFSDKNANKTNDGKNLRLDENDRKNCGTPPVKTTQRYSSDDLYKPRPVLSQRSRRRALEGDIV